MGIGICNLVPGMLIVMTVDAEQLPVTAVGRVIVMVVVLMMNGQLLEPFALKFPAAMGTDPRIYLKGPFPVGGLTGLLFRQGLPGFITHLICSCFSYRIIIF